MIIAHAFRKMPHTGGTARRGADVCAFSGCGRPKVEHAEKPAQQTAGWFAYRKCFVCHAEIGEPCRSRSGRVVDGRPDGVVTYLERAHNSRRLRTGVDVNGS